jgi:acyl carrier protein
MKTAVFISKLKDYLETQEEITPETNLNDLEDYDSLSALTIIALVDEEFNMTLNGNQIKSITSVKSLQELIGMEKFSD